MYRVIAIIGGALALAACSTPNWLSLDAFKPAPVDGHRRLRVRAAGRRRQGLERPDLQDALRARTCRPTQPLDRDLHACRLSSPRPTQLERRSVSTGEPPQLRPNPVYAELTAGRRRSRSAARPGSRSPKKPAAKKPVAAKKPAAEGRAATPAAAAPAAAPAPTSRARACGILALACAAAAAALIRDVQSQTARAIARAVCIPALGWTLWLRSVRVPTCMTSGAQIPLAGYVDGPA